LSAIAKFKLSPKPDDELRWQKDTSLLKSLSVKLFRNHTVRAMDFYDVFVNHKRIEWNGDVESWVYLFNLLLTNKCISTSKGSKPYFKIGREFFFFTIVTGNQALIDFPSMLKNVKNKRLDKHKKTREKIDRILLSCKITSILP
jgi:hypothetical protein